MQNRINVGILFGGRSCEHEVSVTSATSILNAIDRNKYTITLIGIDKLGHWHIGDSISSLTREGAVAELTGAENQLVSLGLHHQGNLNPVHRPQHDGDPATPQLDLIFPVLHGTFGEDGTVQGVLEMAGIPYVGCGVAASALAMDKVLAKGIFSAHGIPQAPYLPVSYHPWLADTGTVLNRIEASLNYPLFTKPANLGSSVGIMKSSSRCELKRAIDHAFAFDNKIVVEASMEDCREIECAVLGNRTPRTSILGEIVAGAEFYNYETKYIDDKSQLIIPAELAEPVAQKVRSLAVDAFIALDACGLARVDFFVHKTSHAIYINEVNTLPGFTPISMYPRLWAASGMEYPALIDRLIELAIDRHKATQRLKRVL